MNPCRKGVAVAIALALFSPVAAIAQQAPKYPIQQEYCWCFCPGQGQLIAVTPSKQPPNARNCAAMSGKQCQQPVTGNIDILKCEGDTIVQETR
jgi:hypothetical protein